MKKYNYGRGWFNESKRHSLARQGIKTGRKSNINYALTTAYGHKYEKNPRIEKQMTIDIKKVKSDDPLAYSYGYFQAKSGQPMSKDKDLAPEYIRGYKDAKAGKKINYAYTTSDLPKIVTEGLGKAGATAVGFIPALVTLGVAKKVVKGGKKIKKQLKK